MNTEPRNQPKEKTLEGHFKLREQHLGQGDKNE